MTHRHGGKDVGGAPRVCTTRAKKTNFCIIRLGKGKGGKGTHNHWRSLQFSSFSMREENPGNRGFASRGAREHVKLCVCYSLKFLLIFVTLDTPRSFFSLLEKSHGRYTRFSPLPSPPSVQGVALRPIFCTSLHSHTGTVGGSATRKSRGLPGRASGKKQTLLSYVFCYSSGRGRWRWKGRKEGRRILHCC